MVVSPKSDMQARGGVSLLIRMFGYANKLMWFTLTAVLKYHTPLSYHHE
jgi:hypothetical protein